MPNDILFWSRLNIEIKVVILEGYTHVSSDDINRDSTLRNHNCDAEEKVD